MPEWLTSWSVKEMVTTSAAICGVIVSFFALRHAFRKDRRAIKVTLSTLMHTFNDGRLGPAYAKIKATNIGHRVVTVTSLTLEVAKRGRLVAPGIGGMYGLPNTELPMTLSDGQSARLCLSYQLVAGALMQHGITKRTKLTPVCEDSSGGIFRGKPWKVDPREMASM